MDNGFNKIDIETWYRKENYIWFTTKNNCKINITANINITNLLKSMKENKFRCYPVFAYMISRIINENDELKTWYNENGELVIWNVVHPRYPIFNEDDKQISILWTEYSKNFNLFYDNFLLDVERYGNIRGMASKGPYPINCFDITSIPWVSFINFTCPNDNFLWFAPFIATGKFFEDNNKFMLPVSITSHHAVTDGYHVSKFFIDFQYLADNFENWLFI